MMSTRFLFAACAVLLAAESATTQTLPASWNRNADWVDQQNPWPDSEGNLVWRASHRRGGAWYGYGAWNPAWGGWVSAGTTIWSGVAPVHPHGMVHMCYYNVLWARHHLVTPVVEFRNVTNQSFDVAIGGSLTVAWHGPAGIAHDTPVSVQMEFFDASNGTTSFLIDEIVLKPTPGSAPESKAFTVNIPPFTMVPQSRTLLTVRGHNYSTFESWITLSDRNLHYVRSVTASETVRQSTPPNPLTLAPGVTSGPILGATWDPVVTDPPGNALLDFLAIGFTPMHQPTPLGVALCDQIAVHAATPGTPFGVAFPDEYVFLGLQLCSQAGRLTPAPDLQLSNALDVVLGDR